MLILQGKYILYINSVDISFTIIKLVNEYVINNMKLSFEDLVTAYLRYKFGVNYSWNGDCRSLK